MKELISDKVRLQHILDAITEIEKYILNVEYREFENNSMMRFACIKQMEIIGEASNHITPITKQKFSEIEWEKITGMRNILVHEYFGVDISIVWQIIKKDIPLLKQKVSDIL